MFQTTLEAKSEGLDPVKHVSAPVINYCSFQGSSSPVVLYSCFCLYLWYASKVVTVISGHFAFSFVF